MKKKRIISFCLVLALIIGSAFIARELYIKIETEKVLAIANEYSQLRLEFREFLYANKNLTKEEIATKWDEFTKKMKNYLDDSSAIPTEIQGTNEETVEYHKLLHSEGNVLIETTRKANCKVESVSIDASEFVVSDEANGEWVTKTTRKSGKVKIQRSVAPGTYKLYFRKINNEWKIILDDRIGL